MDCHALFQGILLTQGSNSRLLHLLHWQADSLPLVTPGKAYVNRFILRTWLLYLVVSKSESCRADLQAEPSGRS